MEPLSGLDASFLYLETASQPLHVCGLFLLDAGARPDGYEFGRLRSALLRRVSGRPEFRRVLRPAPLRLGHPVWTVQADLRVERHVHRQVLPDPGGWLELTELCGRLAGALLDRRRPLWEMHVIEGLADGRVAVFAKFHHSVVDGVAAANLLAYLCDLAPDGPAPTAEPGEPAEGYLSLLGRGARAALGWPWEFARLAWRTLPILPDWIIRSARGAGMPLPFTAPRLSFNHPITNRRAIACAELPFAEIRRIKNACGGTVNDVVLAVVAGALRRYLGSRGELPDVPLVAIVPVSVHENHTGRDDRPAPGANKVTALFSLLPTQLADPVERLRAVMRGERTAKRQQRGIDPYLLHDWARLSLGTVFGIVAALYAGLGMAEWHPVVYNLLVSNVAGPPVPVYLAGHRILAMYPFGPVFHGVGLNITVVSYAGVVHAGVLACRDLVPDPGELAEAIPEALRELSETAGKGGSHRGS